MLLDQMTPAEEVAHVSAQPTYIPTKSHILGVEFDTVRMSQAIRVIDGFVQDGTPHQICLSNAYTVSLCQKDVTLRQITNNSALVLADGMSIVWAGRWVGARLPERVAGPDLTMHLCRWASHQGYSIFLLGADKDTLQALESTLRLRFPTLQIAGTYSPSFCQQLNAQENTNIQTLIEGSKPHILFVGMSAPKQEKWIAENFVWLKVPVCIGVGAAFDFLSGRIRRAPEWLQKIGLEWFYRLYQEPRRLWKRYLLGNLIFIIELLHERIRYHLSKITRALISQ